MPPKNLPQNIEAEQSILCSFLLGNKPDDAIVILEPEDFYKTAHQHIFNAVYSLYKNREPIGAAEVAQELISMNKMEAVTGTYIAQLMDMPQAINIEKCAKIIKECSARRKMIEIAEKTINKAYDKAADVSVVADNLKTEIERISDGNGGYKVEGKIAAEVKEWVTVVNGSFNISSIYNELHLITKEQKTAARMALLRLLDKGIVSRDGNKNGMYRKVEFDDTIMEFVEEDIYDFPIRLPFGLNDICSILTQNIIIIGGSKSSGKTAFLLNLALKNQDTVEIEYLNSEMSKDEYSVRMKALGCTSKDDIKFKMRSCHANFQDRIDGTKKIWLIDYLEIHDEFWKVASQIRMIHEKLGDGVAVVAIQKKGVEKLARGAEFSMEKSRLYITLDYIEGSECCTKMTIQDAKACRLPGGARGLSKRIKILNGSTMLQLDKEWTRG